MKKLCRHIVFDQVCCVYAICDLFVVLLASKAYVLWACCKYPNHYCGYFYKIWSRHEDGFHKQMGVSMILYDRILNLKSLLSQKSFLLFGPRQAGKSSFIDQRCHQGVLDMDLHRHACEEQIRPNGLNCAFSSSSQRWIMNLRKKPRFNSAWVLLECLWRGPTCLKRSESVNRPWDG